MKPLALAALSAAALVSLPAAAEPAFARMYKAEYGYQPSCNACHKDGGGSALNGYGHDFDKQPKTRASFGKIAGLDSDGDKAPNAAEIKAKSNPGDSDSTPDKRGPWLDTTNLIPKAVQAAFPGVVLYKPLDAIYTDKEIKRAAAMNVALAAEDENTIYIPVQERKAAGTAIIVPGRFAETDYYVLVATDRGLTVTAVSSVVGRGDDALEAVDLSSFVGQKATTLEVKAEPSSLQEAVAATVKKAAVMVLVRLKKS